MQEMKAKACTGDPGGPDAKSGRYSSGSGFCPAREKAFFAHDNRETLGWGGITRSASDAVEGK